MKSIGEKRGPTSVHLIKGSDAILLLAECRARVLVFWDCDCDTMTTAGELIGKIVDVDCAIGAEVVVENEKNVAHASTAAVIASFEVEVRIVIRVAALDYSLPLIE